MQIRTSARRHGIPDADIRHAFRNAVLRRVFEYDGQERVFIVGPDRAGRLLELVAVPAPAPTRIIHADRLRRSFHEKMR